MRCVDVNVLVYAYRVEAPDHEQYRRWLEDARRESEPLGLMGVVLSGFLRVVTHPRIFREPTPLDVALEFVLAARQSPACVPVEPGERHWELFVDLSRGSARPGTWFRTRTSPHSRSRTTQHSSPPTGGFVVSRGCEVQHPLEQEAH